MGEGGGRKDRAVASDDLHLSRGGGGCSSAWPTLGRLSLKRGGGARGQHCG